jgi:[acyl-carrier-protein] S-malonyltransferase
VSTAAYVRGEPVSAAEVEARLARVRSSGFGARLPDAATAEGRNARRWVAQLICAERLVGAELGAPTGPRGALTIDRALGVGGVAAAVLTVRPDAIRVVPAPDVDEASVRGYYDRNADRYADRGIAYATARESIAATLNAAARDRAFAAWLEQRMARDVELQPGFEHPADPRHADATHRH